MNSPSMGDDSQKVNSLNFLPNCWSVPLDSLPTPTIVSYVYNFREGSVNLVRLVHSISFLDLLSPSAHTSRKCFS